MDVENGQLVIRGEREREKGDERRGVFRRKDTTQQHATCSRTSTCTCQDATSHHIMHPSCLSGVYVLFQ